jgi:hypothetical protein
MPVDAYVDQVHGGSICQLKLMSGPVGSGKWILGLNFFPGYYTVFDAGHQRVGFARSVNAQGSEVPRLNSQITDLVKNTGSGRVTLWVCASLGVFTLFVIIVCLCGCALKRQVKDIDISRESSLPGDTTDDQHFRILDDSYSPSALERLIDTTNTTDVST